MSLSRSLGHNTQSLEEELSELDTETVQVRITSAALPCLPAPVCVCPPLPLNRAALYACNAQYYYFSY